MLLAKMRVAVRQFGIAFDHVKGPMALIAWENGLGGGEQGRGIGADVGRVMRIALEVSTLIWSEA